MLARSVLRLGRTHTPRVIKATNILTRHIVDIPRKINADIIKTSHIRSFSSIKTTIDDIQLYAQEADQVLSSIVVCTRVLV